MDECLQKLFHYMKGEIHVGTLKEIVDREEVPKSALDRTLCFTTYSVQGETWDRGRGVGVRFLLGDVDFVTFRDYAGWWWV